MEAKKVSLALMRDWLRMGASFCGMQIFYISMG